MYPDQICTAVAWDLAHLSTVGAVRASAAFKKSHHKSPLGLNKYLRFQAELMEIAKVEKNEFEIFTTYSASATISSSTLGGASSRMSMTAESSDLGTD